MGSGGPRDTIENVVTLGNTVGPKLDKFASRSVEGGIPTAEMAGAVLETAHTGIPLISGSLMGVGTAAGAQGAANAAQKFQPSNWAQFAQAVNANPTAQAALQKVRQVLIDPALNATAAGKETIAETIRQQAGIIGGATGVAVTPSMLNAAALGMGYLAQKAMPGHANGGRTYAKGGSVKPSHDHLVSRLMSLAETAKKAEKERTKAILSVPDDAVTTALQKAQAAI